MKTPIFNKAIFGNLRLILESLVIIVFLLLVLELTARYFNPRLHVPHKGSSLGVELRDSLEQYMVYDLPPKKWTQ